MKKHLSTYYFLLITICVGYFLAVQIRATIPSSQGIVTIQKILEMKHEIDNTKKDNANLVNSINEAKLKLQDYEVGKDKPGNILEIMQEELKLARDYADYAKLVGPGIIINMNDSLTEVGEYENPSSYLIHDQDILVIINELRAAGAEAISINDERVSATSNIRCGGPTINIDGKRHAVPFIIKAIGDPQKLEASMLAPSSYIALMEYYDIRIDIKKIDKLTINAYDVKYKLKYQKKIEGGE